MPGENFDDADNSGESGLNMEELIASVGDELFPKDTSSEELQSTEPTEPALGKTVPAQAENQPGLTPAQIKALPKAWKKEMEAHWTKLPPEVHDYVYAREADVQRGLQEYSTGYKQWQALISPYQELLNQHPDVNPVELMQVLMNSHLTLSRASPEERKTLGLQLLQSYGINLEPEAPLGAQDAQVKIATLERRLAEMERGINSQRETTQQRLIAEKQAEVERFAAAPENEFYSVVAPDMARLLKNGEASTLADAYNKACWLNPEVRTKMLAKQQAANSAPAKGVIDNKPKMPNLSSNIDTVNRQQRKGTIDDTINSVVAKYVNSL